MPRPLAASRTFALLAALAGAAPGLARSQTPAGIDVVTGVLQGIVEDSQGAAVPGARVTVRNVDTGIEHTVTTDTVGRFGGPLLPGIYRVSVSLDGFATLVREKILVSAGETVSLRLQLSPYEEPRLPVRLHASQEERFRPVWTGRVEGDDRIGQRALRGLPSSGRSFPDLLTLTPGVSVVPGPTGDGLSMNGQKAIHNQVAVDGADSLSPFFGDQRGGPRSVFPFNLDAIEEVVVVAEGAPAELGRASSGFLQVVTRSGTNHVHGSAHVHLESDALAAQAKTGRPAPEDRAPKPDVSRQQLGFTLGGPFKKQRLFYFLAVDFQRERSARQTDPLRIEPRLVDFFAALDSPDENGPVQRTNDARALTAILDWRPSDSDAVTLRYTHAWSERKNGMFAVESWGRSANGIERGSSHAVTGSATSELSPRLANEFRCQYARESRPRLYDGPEINGQGRPLPDTAFDSARGYRFGMPYFLPLDHVDERVQLGNSLTMFRGQHLLKAGFEFNWARSVQTSPGFANGRWVFSSTDGFLGYAANPRYVECSDGTSSPAGVCPPATTIVGPVLLYRQQAGASGLTPEQAGTQSISQTEPAFFIQDQWRLSRRLTLQYGLRWEAQVQPEPLTPAADVFFAPFIGATSEGEAFPSDGTLPSDYRMFQPRVGVSWDPGGDGKTAVKMSGGVFYARVPGVALAPSRSTDGSRGQILTRSSALAGVLGPPPAYPSLIPQAETAGPVRPDVFVFAKDFRNPRTYVVSLSVERELLHDLAVLVRYTHAKGVHLTRFVDRNDPLLGDGLAPAPWATGLPPADGNGIHTLTTAESAANSLYRGLALKVRKRWSRGWQAEANYTLAKDLSDDDNEGDPFSLRYAKVTDLAAEYGPSDRDRRHRFNGWLLWTAPGKVTASVRYSFRSAQPTSVTRDGRDARTPADRLNPDGSVTPRNQGREDDAFSSLDLRLGRPIRVGEGTLEPVLDVFNLLNGKNLVRPGVASLVFDLDRTVRSGPGDPRRVQLGLRYTW